MKALRITRNGGPEVLALEDVDVPKPGPWDVLVRVAASALNRADILQRRGLYPAPHGAPADIPGLELAGVVDACGAFVTRFAVGDAVMALVGGGACAEYAVVHEREAMRVPAGLDLADAAAIPEAFITAFDAAILQGGLASGQWLAIDAVASGVGTAAVQIAKAVGARVAGSTRSADKVARVEALGADLVVHGETGDLAKAVVDATAGDGAAVGVSLVGGPALAALLGGVRKEGTVILVGLMAGTRCDLPLGLVLTKRLKIAGTTLRSRPIEAKIAVARAFEDRMVPLFEGDAPKLAPVVDLSFDLADAADAHRAMEDNRNVGKIVLRHA